MATLEVELFHCERYRPLAGWSSDFLLPTDQHAFRARGKKGGWPTIAEAEAALLPPGWAWEELRGAQGEALRWQPDAGGAATDVEGWQYGTNFTSTFEGSNKRTMQAFTRWRRLVRTQTFKGLDTVVRAFADAAGSGMEDKYLNGCLNVDLDFATQVGMHLQEALAAASLYSDWSLPAFVKLKWELFGQLGSHKEPGKDSFEAFLADFVSAHRGVALRFAELFKAADDEVLRARVVQVDGYFPPLEREAFAVITIRLFRRDKACRAGAEEHECSLRPVLCTNRGCSERFSAIAADVHDVSCQFKRVPCEKCLEVLPRGELRGHAAAACPMRDASCSFKAIGCDKPLSRSTVATHLEECTQAHLLLLLNTMLDQRNTIQQLSQRVRDLEAGRQEFVAQRASQAALGAQVTELEGKLAALDKRVAKDVAKTADDAKKRSEAAEKEAKKWSDSSAASIRNELKTLRTELSTVKTSFYDLDKKLQPVFQERVAAQRS